MKNIRFQQYEVTMNKRRNINKHSSFFILFTGLSCSGKSTLANLVEKELHNLKVRTYALDGDNLRSGINKDLGFTKSHREENIRRVAEIGKLMVESGLVVLAAFIAPYKKDRENISKIVKKENFIEIFINTSLEECEKRDSKGLYSKARKGEIKNMTGISSPYEKPQNPNIEIKTRQESLEESVTKIMKFIRPKLTLLNE
ncbi:MAG: adenylylsulfate kinase [Polaribacter sp.]|jgi:adenylylsulfate kinase|tara:strand:- start:163 stop:762 length:600 start_codon:yes stop_codon:yes gene_type:complete